METHPLNELPPSRTFALAVLSLVFSVLTIFLGIFAAIAAVIFGLVALSRIRSSNGTLTGKSMAITGIATSMVLSFFVTAMEYRPVGNHFARQNACINNLRQLDGAVQQWALENHKDSNAVPTWADVSVYLKSTVVCPSGGTYTLHRVADPPTCSIPGHELPQLGP